MQCPAGPEGWCIHSHSHRQMQESAQSHLVTDPVRYITDFTHIEKTGQRHHFKSKP